MVPRPRATRVWCPLIVSLLFIVLMESERLMAMWLAPTTRAGTVPAVSPVSRLLRRRRKVVSRRIALLNRPNPVQTDKTLVPSRLGLGIRLGVSVVVRLDLQGATIGLVWFSICC